jgi:hypothetical protein
MASISGLSLRLAQKNGVTIRLVGAKRLSGPTPQNMTQEQELKLISNLASIALATS